MKRPTWATVVGVLGIIFSCFGILGAGQEILMPMMLDLQKEMFASIEKQIELEAEKKSRDQKGGDGDQRYDHGSPPEEVFSMMRKMWFFPDWFKEWSVFSGILKLIINGLYLFAAIMILLVRPYAITLFYGAAGSSIAFGIVRGVVMISAMSILGIAMMIWGVFGIIIDIVLILVVAMSDKKAFRSSGTAIEAL